MKEMKKMKKMKAVKLNIKNIFLFLSKLLKKFFIFIFYMVPKTYVPNSLSKNNIVKQKQYLKKSQKLAKKWYIF